MSDLINRQDAIDAVSEGCEEWRGIFSRCEANLLSLPPAQKKGEWIKCSDTAFYWMCSECGAYLFWRKEKYLLRKDDEANFCPNCGADMRGDT